VRLVLVLLLALAVRAGADCPARVVERGRPPGITAQHEQLAYWLRVIGGRHDLDAALLSSDDIAAYDATARRLGASSGVLLGPVDAAAVGAQVASVMGVAEKRLADGVWKDGNGRTIDPSTLPALRWRPDELTPELRVLLAPASLRCIPLTQPLFGPDDPEHDDDVAACSRLGAQEVVQVLADGPGTMRLVRTRYALGWIGRTAAMSPPIPDEWMATYVHGPRVAAPRAVRLRTIALPARTSLPSLPGGRVLLGTANGVVAVKRDPAQVPVRRRLTRRTILTDAFAGMGHRYGLGGTNDGIDCSAFVLDAFESAGMELPRHSSDQARAGTITVDLRGITDPAARLARLDEADRAGVVVIYLPGHVALYLGRDARGVPMAIHAFGGWRTVCADGTGETKHVIRRVAVSGLDLGAGTREGSLLQRAQTLAVFGKAPR
jgi:hypothetical protein